MLSTRLLPPQFLLPAWSAGQLAQAAQRAHKSDYTKGHQDKHGDRTVRQHAERKVGRQIRRRRVSESMHGILRLNLKPVEAEGGLNTRRATPKEKLDGHQTTEQLHGSGTLTGDYDENEDKRSRRHASQHHGKFKLHTSSNPPGDVKRAVRGPPPELKTETKSTGQDLQPQPGQISLFEELFPEEALAQKQRERIARDRLERLPAFNWAVETEELEARDRDIEDERNQFKRNYRTVPGVKSGRHTVQGTTSPSAKQAPASQRRGQIQEQTWQDESIGKRSRASVLVLRACSKTLHESDFLRVGPKGNQVESWTNGILKVIPARDNVTLEPLGQYFLLFSSLAAARLYLDRALRLTQLAQSRDDLSRYSARLRDEEDVDAVKRNFTLVPVGGKLSLILLQPPYSRGLQWMINAGGPAPLVMRQSKSQNIVLFSTDRGYVKNFELENAIMDDGKSRNLHWKLAGPINESIVKLETKATPAGEDAETSGGTAHSPRSTYRGPARYTLLFKDSNEARRFAREWHRRPFPTKRLPQPGDGDPPIVNAEILW